MKLQGEILIPCRGQGYEFQNPVGYTRTTQRSKWSSPTYRKYVNWCEWVAKCFHEQCEGLRVPDRQKCRLDMMIYYSGDNKSDPSNVFKGIEDALADYGVDIKLYKNDNYTCGSFDFDYDKENPRVEVSISF